MAGTAHRVDDKCSSWLLFMFQLSVRRARQRVSVWRKLQKYGTLNWKNCAHILPLNSSNLEKFQWLAAEVQKYQGESSVVEVPRIYGHTDKQVMAMFNRARALQYADLIRNLRLALRAAASQSKAEQGRLFTRLNRRLAELNTIDFFGCAKRREAEDLIKELEARTRRNGTGTPAIERKPGMYGTKSGRPAHVRK